MKAMVIINTDVSWDSAGLFDPSQAEHSDMQMIGQENCFTKHNT